jgi:hypothetical protein
MLEGTADWLRWLTHVFQSRDVGNDFVQASTRLKEGVKPRNLRYSYMFSRFMHQRAFCICRDRVRVNRDVKKKNGAVLKIRTLQIRNIAYELNLKNKICSSRCRDTPAHIAITVF